MENINALKRKRNPYTTGSVQCASCTTSLTHTNYIDPTGCYTYCGNVNCLNQEEQENAYERIYCGVCHLELGTHAKGMYKFIESRVIIQPDEDSQIVKPKQDPFSRRGNELSEIKDIFKNSDQNQESEILRQEIMELVKLSSTHLFIPQPLFNKEWESFKLN